MRCYEIRDVDLPAEPPLAVLHNYEAATATVRELHEQLYEQLVANGEGASCVSQRLSVVEVGEGLAAAVCALSSVSGSVR